MSKTPNTQTLNKLSLAEDWSTHPAVEWLSSHKQIILWVIAALLGLIIVAYRLAIVHTENAESDFFRAQNIFQQFDHASVSAQETSAATDLAQLEDILIRHPELKAKYDGALAQTLLIAGQPEKARSFEEGVFKRTSTEHLQLYQDFSKASLLIGEAKYPEALAQTIQLQQGIDPVYQTTLYIFNSIRVAMLNQQLGHREAELNAWKQLQSLPQEVEAVIAENSELNAGLATLKQYIQERQKILAS